MDLFFFSFFCIRFEARFECNRRKVGLVKRFHHFCFSTVRNGWMELTFLASHWHEFRVFPYNGRHSRLSTMTDGRHLAYSYFYYLPFLSAFLRPWPTVYKSVRSSYIFITMRRCCLAFGSCFHIFCPANWLVMHVWNLDAISFPFLFSNLRPG